MKNIALAILAVGFMYLETKEDYDNNFRRLALAGFGLTAAIGVFIIV